MNQEKTRFRARLNNRYGGWCMFREKWNVHLGIICIEMVTDVKVFRDGRMEWDGVQRVKAPKCCLVECQILIEQALI